MIVSGCEAFVHPYDMDWYQNPCKWYDKPEPGWYCKTHPPESE